MLGTVSILRLAFIFRFAKDQENPFPRLPDLYQLNKKLLKCHFFGQIFKEKIHKNKPPLFAIIDANFAHPLAFPRKFTLGT